MVSLVNSGNSASIVRFFNSKRVNAVTSEAFELTRTSLFVLLSNKKTACGYKSSNASISAGFIGLRRNNENSERLDFGFIEKLGAFDFFAYVLVRSLPLLCILR